MDLLFTSITKYDLKLINNGKCVLNLKICSHHE